MDIAAMSMALAQHNVQTDVGIAMLDKSMSVSESFGTHLTDMIDTASMELSINPSLGANIDISL